MKYFVALILSTFFHVFALLPSTLGISDEACKDITSKSAYTRLHSYLKCNFYDKNTNKRSDNNYTEIHVFMTTNVFNFNEKNDNLEFHGLFYISWKDENIEWNATLYDDIDSTPVHTRYVWTPDIAYLNAGNDDKVQRGVGDITCKLGDDGRIECVDFITRSIRCETDYKVWPYDRPKCTLIITSWSHSSTEMTLTLFYVTPEGSNGEWNYRVTRISHNSRESYYHGTVGSPQIAIDFTLERSYTHIRGRFVAPAIIMMAMTLTAMWLDPESIERRSIACLNIIIHMLCIHDIHWALPRGGTTTPNLIIFYADSLVLAIIALVLTFVLRRVKDAKVTAPHWISSTISPIVKTKVGHFLLLAMLDSKIINGTDADNDDPDELLSSPTAQPAWIYVVVILSWIFFFVFFFTYIIMYVVLILSSGIRTPIEVQKN